MPAIIRNGHIYSASPKVPIDADEISYDNSISGLTATDAQDAIDELKELVDQDQDTTYTLGTNDNKVTLTPSEGTAQSITVPYATSAGNANTVSNHTVAKDVPADAKFTDTTYENATTTVAGLMSTADKSKLDGIASGAEVNQNTFSNIVANGTTVSADSKTDTLTIEAGSNVTITGDATNDKITISATDTTYSDATTATHGLMSTTDKSKLDGIAAGAEVNVQANWTETNSSADAYIKNKPTLGTAAAKDIPATGNASTSQVVMGNDTRLSDARNAADVYSWAKASTKPTYSYSEITNTPTIPTITDTYSETSSDGMSGKAVKSAIDALDGTITGTAGVGKTITALSQTDGKVSATFGNISITKSQVSDFPSLGNAAAKNYTTSVTNGSSDLVTSGAVWTAIDNLPEPMVFKGSLGTGGTITALPVDGSAAIGDTYKIITAGTYASKTAKVGDTFICLTKTSSANTWELIPSGDEPSGTVTSVGVSNGGGLSVSGSPVTTSGTITISHADTSSQASVNNSGRTYIQDITLDTYGHVTGIASATETVTNTDRYVNSASFAHDSTNDNVKMTLTRAGSDTATVTGNIPKVSSSSAGVAPKGAAVSSQTQTTKFLREDGIWAAPSYTTNTNTTYTFAAGTNSFKVTPSGGTAQTVNVTPSVSKSDVGLGNVANLDQSKAITSITRSGKTFTATALDGTTSSFTQQDNNTTYSNATTAAAGLMSKDDKSKLDGIASGATANSFATGTTNGTINVNTNGSTVDVAVKGLAALAYKSSLGKSDIGLGNVANLDQSKAIKSITRSGTTFTATAIDGTTSSFTQQDNNTTYSNATTAAAGLMSKDDKVKLNGIATGATANTGTVTSVGLTAGTGISVSGGPVTTSGSITVTNSGVRAVATGTANGTINVNTNGTTVDVAVKGLGSAAYTASTAYATSGHTHTTSMATGSASSLTLAANTKYTLTAGGTTFAFTTPPDNNTTYSNATTAKAGLMAAADKIKVDGAVTQVKVGTTAYNPSSGTVSLPAYPTSLPASNTTDTYSATGTVPVSGKAVAAALGTLDVSAVGGSGKYITTISETDGKISATAATADTTVTSGSSNLVTSGAVYTAIDNLPEPMVFKGSLGTGGTITALPVNGTASIGDTYKVITAGTYASQAAKVGDTFICDSKTSSANTWVLIPSGDEPSGTVTSVTIKATSPIAIDSANAITTSGTRTISHANSGATAGSYGDSVAQTPAYGGTFKVPYVTVNATGHVTAISEHTVKIPASDNTNTTYTFANGTNGFTVTPSGGSAQTVTVTPNDSTKLPLAGGTMTGNINFANGGTATRGITATIADSDAWRMVGGQTATNAGYLEIATADDYNEPIYVRQYQYGDSSTPFGSVKKEAVLLDASGNTSFPGTVTAASFSGSIANATGLTKSQVTTALGYTPPTTDTNTTYSAGSNITLTGTVFSLTKANVTGALGYTPPTTNTTYSNVSTSAAGLAPKVTSTSAFLKGDGTWATPTNTTYSNVSTSAAGLAPKVTSTSAFLKGDGTWATPTNTTYSNVSTSAAGLAPKITNTANFLKGDGTWTMPTKANVGLGNVANYDQSKAIKSITRSGTTFTATALDGTTSTFNQQDNNTQTALVGATSAANGSVGYINAAPPKDGYNTKYFRADGTWVIPPNTKYTASTISIGSASTGTAIAADDITAWSAGSVPSLTITNTTCDDITAQSAGTAASASVANGVLTITNGTAPSLSYTARTVGSASGQSAGSAPSLSYTARSIPNISVASKTVVTGITES